MQLAKRVWDFSTSQDLLHDGDRVVIGVSGGPDSLCLLDVLHSLAPRHRLELHVAHLNHALRPEAEAEAGFVREEAERHGAGYISETLDIAAAAKANRRSIETTARELRYDFFRRVARQAGAHLVAVAHTADDQAETVLMHLLRGSGLRGLRGMLPKTVMGNWDSSASRSQLPITDHQLLVFVIRPMLQTTRFQVLAYCAQHKLTPRTDSSNADRRYFRNRLRHELLPVLESYNPNVRTVLARTAAVSAGDYEIWLEAVQGLWTTSVRAAPGDAGRVVFDRARWLALSAAQQRALLRAAAEQLAPGGDEIDFAPLDAAVHFSRGAAPGRSCQLAGGLVLRVEAEQIIVCSAEGGPITGDRPRVVDGVLAPGWRLLIEPLGAGGLSLGQIAAAPLWTAYVDAERLVEPIQLRARRPGDRFQPLGLDGHTVKLAAFLVNRKVPAQQREQWPLLTCGDDIVWVVGLALDERYKVTAGTRQVTRLAIAPVADE